MSILDRFRKSASNAKPDACDPPLPRNAGDDPKELGQVVASILNAVAGARRSLDAATCELAKLYWADPILRSLPVPAFNIPEVTVNLKFAVYKVDPSRTDPMQQETRVIVDAASLSQLPANLISHIELKITPESVRIFEANGGEIRLNRA